MADSFRSELTEEEKLDYATVRIPRMERGEIALLCPWCSKINRQDMPVCCGPMQDAREKLGKRRFDSILKQLWDVKSGRAVSLRCPYCDKWNKRATPDTHPSEWTRPNVNPFCCDLMSDAATAIVERMTLERLTEDKKRIEDTVAKN
jgi:uncharacterized C2H2 Zn-finger protein